MHKENLSRAQNRNTIRKTGISAYGFIRMRFVFL